MAKHLSTIFTIFIIANSLYTSEAQFSLDTFGESLKGFAKTGQNVLGNIYNQAASGVSSLGGGGIASPGADAGDLANPEAAENPIAGRELGGSYRKGNKQVSFEDSSEEKPRRSHHHHHHQSKSHQQLYQQRNEQRQEQKQLESTGGGFNANINQDNKFAPVFGNIGDIGSVARDPITGRQYVVEAEDNSGERIVYPRHKKHARSRYPRKFSKPEYFFDFRQVFIPEDSSSSEESDGI